MVAMNASFNSAKRVLRSSFVAPVLPASKLRYISSECDSQRFVRFVVVLTLVAKRTHLFGQLVLSFALGLDGLVRFLDRVDHLLR